MDDATFETIVKTVESTGALDRSISVILSRISSFMIVL